jgi:putative intracellular protease/amidase
MNKKRGDPIKILIVLTSHDQLGNTGRKTGFWLEEFTAPYYVLQDAGVEITLASPAGGQPPLDPVSDAPDAQTASTERFKDDATAQHALGHTVKLAEVDDADYDAIFFPGGHGPLWDLAESADSKRLIEAFFNSGRTVAAVCHAPAVFRHTIDAEGRPLVAGRRVTCFSNTEEAAVGLTDVVPFLVEDMLKANDGVYEKGPDWGVHVVVDGLLVTGQNPASSAAVAEVLIARQP